MTGVSCGNCKHRLCVAVCYVTIGCKHEHLLIDHPCCVLCLHTVLHAAFCARCLRAGCEYCPMTLTRLLDVDRNEVTGRAFVLARQFRAGQQPVDDEKMIFGHASARAE